MRLASPALVLLALVLAPRAVAQEVLSVGPFEDHRLEVAPALAPMAAVEGAEAWSDRFAGPPGVDGYTTAVVSWRGDLYAGGAFRSAGGGRTVAGALARWDGAAWHDVGGGLFDPPACPYSNCGSAYALLPTDGALVVGGRFGPAQGGPGEFPFETIAAWDGATWRGLGPGLRWDDPSTDGSTVSGGWVEALVETEEGLVAGGWFNRAGDAPVSNVARWDGEAWDALGGGLPFWVESLATDGDRLVAVGYRDLETYLGVSVAEWDGTAWIVGTLDAPFGDDGGRVDAAAFFDGDLVVGGLFEAIDRVPAHSIARWDGTVWHPLGDGVDSNVWDLAVSPEGELVAGGLFRTAGGEPAGRVAAWDGRAWRSLGGGVRNQADRFRGRVDGVGVADGDLVVAGVFEAAGGAVAANVARWDGAGWSAFGEPAGDGLSGAGVAVAPASDGVYVGGAFVYAGGTEVSGIARWDGDEWHARGDGLEGTVQALAIEDGGDRVAATGYGVLDGAAVAEWDGAAWAPLLSSTVELYAAWSAAYHRGDLYVAGNFYDLATETAPVLMRWSGTDWEPPPGADGGVIPSAYLLTDGDRLILHGGYDEVAGVPTGPLAAWDGTAWAPVGAPLSGSVRDVVFDAAGPVVVGRVGVGEGETPLQVLRWDGAAWQSVGGDLETPYFSGRGEALAVAGDEAFVLGRFPENQTLLRASLDGGGAWAPVEGAPSADRGDLLARDGSLIVVGSFTRAGGLPSSNVAVLALDAPPTDAGRGPEAATLALRIGPNPVARGRAATVALDLAAPAHVRVAVVDLLGREVAVLADGPAPQGTRRLGVETAGLAPGLYLVTARGGAARATARFVVGGGGGGR